MKQTKPTANCELCGEPMPKGEEMFKYHGYSGPCPKPPLAKPSHLPDIADVGHDITNCPACVTKPVAVPADPKEAAEYFAAETLSSVFSDWSDPEGQKMFQREVANLLPILESFRQSVLQGQWIPVSERLPKEGAWVLAFLPEAEAELDTRMVPAWLSNGQWEGEFHTLEGVTHWQPLPAPPTGPEQGGK